LGELSEGRLPQLAEEARQVSCRMMGVQFAGIGQHPDHRLRQLLWLKAKDGTRPLQCRAIGRDAQESHEARPIAYHLSLQELSTFAQLLFREIVRASAGASDEVGVAIAQRQQLALLVG
jgi:2'-5' RNA ligase